MEVIELNVGGKFYTTYKSTLCNPKGSMLESMFSGRFPMAKDAQGKYFIDRDGEVFDLILYYLRSGVLLIPHDELLKRKLHIELDYYGIKWTQYYRESTLITPEYEQMLVDWIDATPKRLLYRGTTDGFTKEDFYGACDRASSTVLIAQTTGGYIFGWYQLEKHEVRNFTQTEPAAFFFSLKNPKNEIYRCPISAPYEIASSRLSDPAIRFGTEQLFQIVVPVNKDGKPETWTIRSTRGLDNMPSDPLLFNGGKSGIKIAEIEVFTNAIFDEKSPK